MPSLLDLPDSLLEACLLHLPLAQRARAAAISRRLQHICAASDALWHEAEAELDADYFGLGDEERVAHFCT